MGTRDIQDRLESVLKQSGVQAITPYGSVDQRRRERMALEAVDEFLAREPETIDLEKRKKEKEDAQKKILEIWAEIRAGK